MHYIIISIVQKNIGWMRYVYNDRSLKKDYTIIIYRRLTHMGKPFFCQKKGNYVKNCITSKGSSQ